MIGVFSIQGSANVYSTFMIDKQKSQIVIPNGKVAFRVYHPFLTATEPYASIVDSNGNFIQQIQLVSDQNCLNLAVNAGHVTSDWFCNS